MKANIGSADKIIRIILGVVIIALGFYYQTWWGAVCLVPLLTASMNFCPAYNLIGISTKKKIDTEKLKV